LHEAVDVGENVLLADEWRYKTTELHSETRDRQLTGRLGQFLKARHSLQ
jgi:hypothetical protein